MTIKRKNASSTKYTVRWIEFFFSTSDSLSLKLDAGGSGLLVSFLPLSIIVATRDMEWLFSQVKGSLDDDISEGKLLINFIDGKGQ